MAKIITVSRQFGSGGRELGKRLSDLLGWDYYDREIIREIAEEGSDCIIVGRDADVILHEEHPFRIYVCADIRNRLERCMRFEEKKEPEERLTEKEILRNIRRIDRNRRQIREILTGKSATDGSAFDLTVNATGWDIKKLAEAVAEFSGRWFAK